MDYLELINRTRIECGASGASTPLFSVTGLTGETARIANWVNSAWVDIQTAHEDWQFMRESFEFNTVAQQQAYTKSDAGVAATFGNWKVDSFRASTVGQNYADEQILNLMDYDTFRNIYMYGSMRTTYQRPVVVSVKPNKDLLFGAIPDQAYVISGEYYRSPVRFTSATDSPDIPARFQMMIVYKAMMYYGGYDAASEVYSRGLQEFNRLMSRLEIDQLPIITNGPPLA
jgi:hypothetical protein